MFHQSRFLINVQYLKCINGGFLCRYLLSCWNLVSAFFVFSHSWLPASAIIVLIYIWLHCEQIVAKSPTKYLPRPHLLQPRLLLHVTTWKMWSGLRIALVFILNLWCLLLPAVAPFSTQRLENVAYKWQGPCSGLFSWLCFRGLSNNVCSRGSRADGSAVTASKRTPLLWPALPANHSLFIGSHPLLQSEALSLQP